MENYEKKCKEALVIVKQMVTDGQISQEVAEKYFPELAESEDEKIRKEMIEHLEKTAIEFPLSDVGLKADSWIAYLEKLGEQNPVNSIWHDMTENPEGDVNDRTLVVFEDGYSTTSNALLHIGFGTSKSYKWAYVNDILRLTSNTKQSEQKPTDKVEQKFKVGDIVRASKSKGAMLKIVGITDYCYNCVTCTTNDEYSFGFDIQDEFELVEQNPAWSEEDEHMFNTIANSLNIEKVERVWHTTEKEVDNWLKSLKERYTWKPSDEQMTALRRMKNAIGGEGEIYEPLNSLYEDLKKLKEK